MTDGWSSYRPQPGDHQVRLSRSMESALAHLADRDADAPGWHRTDKYGLRRHQQGTWDALERRGLIELRSVWPLRLEARLTEAGYRALD